MAAVLAGGILGFAFGYVVAKPTHDDVKKERDAYREMLTKALADMERLTDWVEDLVGSRRPR